MLSGLTDGKWAMPASKALSTFFSTPLKLIVGRKNLAVPAAARAAVAPLCSP